MIYYRFVLFLVKRRYFFETQHPVECYKPGDMGKCYPSTGHPKKGCPVCVATVEEL